MNTMDDDEDDTGSYEPPTEEECAKKGHCFCIQEGKSTCCWCGFFDPVVYKKNRLRNINKFIEDAVKEYPEETKEILKKHLG